MMALENTALLTCLPTILEKKKVYIAPRKGFVIVIISPSSRFTMPDSRQKQRISRNLSSAMWSMVHLQK